MAIKRKNIKRVIQTLKNTRDMKFNMNWYLSEGEKGSWSGCVGGFTFYTATGRFLKSSETQFDAREKASKFLGINSDEATKLFVPRYPFSAIRRKHAIKVLKHLRKTGKVDWDVANVGY